MCPKGELDLVFPNGVGRIESHANIRNRGFIPAQIAAGITTGAGKAKYTGLHSLRHFYASWCINRRADGGRTAAQDRAGPARACLSADDGGPLRALVPRGDSGANSPRRRSPSSGKATSAAAERRRHP